LGMAPIRVIILLVRRVKSAFVEFNLFTASFSSLNMGTPTVDVLVDSEQIAGLVGRNMTNEVAWIEWLDFCSVT